MKINNFKSIFDLNLKILRLVNILMEIKLNMKLQYRNLKMIVCVAKDNLIGSSSPQGNGLLWYSTKI